MPEVVPLRRQALRLVRTGETLLPDRDSAVASTTVQTAFPAAPADFFAPPDASAFLAGQGARLYSLDVFRRERNPNPPGPNHRTPHAA